MSTGTSQKTIAGCVLFLGYGLFCILFRQAYLPGTINDDYALLVMRGWHAVAFGASLILLSACLEVSRRLQGQTAAQWFFRILGFAAAVAGVVYGTSGGQKILIP